MAAAVPALNLAGRTSPTSFYNAATRTLALSPRRLPPLTAEWMPAGANGLKMISPRRPVPVIEKQSIMPIFIDRPAGCPPPSQQSRAADVLLSPRPPRSQTLEQNPPKTWRKPPRSTSWTFRPAV